MGPLSSLWNGSKSGWGEWARAEEILAVVGAQLGQIGAYSALEMGLEAQEAWCLGLGGRCRR